MRSRGRPCPMTMRLRTHGSKPTSRSASASEGDLTPSSVAIRSTTRRSRSISPASMDMPAATRDSAAPGCAASSARVGISFRKGGRSLSPCPTETSHWAKDESSLIPDTSNRRRSTGSTSSMVFAALCSSSTIYRLGVIRRLQKRRCFRLPRLLANPEFARAIDANLVRWEYALLKGEDVIE